MAVVLDDCNVIGKIEQSTLHIGMVSLYESVHEHSTTPSRPSVAPPPPLAFSPRLLLLLPRPCKERYGLVREFFLQGRKGYLMPDSGFEKRYKG